MISLKIIYGGLFSEYFTENDDDSGIIITCNSLVASRKVALLYENFEKIFIVNATGWSQTFAAYPDILVPKITHVKGPYSEHCSNQELLSFV